MSGGYFEYKQYQIADIVDGIERAIEKYGGNYSKKTISKFRRAQKLLRVAEIYANRIDWLLSDDDGEDEFHKRLSNELATEKKFGRQRKRYRAWIEQHIDDGSGEIRNTEVGTFDDFMMAISAIRSYAMDMGLPIKDYDRILAPKKKNGASTIDFGSYTAFGKIFDTKTENKKGKKNDD
jgi:hypothetical protein